MLKIKLSSKRQATFPKQVCESLGIEAGDEILLDRRTGDDGEIWVLQPAREVNRPWLGSLRHYSAKKKHGMESIRTSIAGGRQSSDR